MASSRQTRGGNSWDKCWSKLAVAESTRIMLDLRRSLSRNAGTLRVMVAIASAFSGRWRRALSRFVGVAITSGPHVATRKATRRIHHNWKQLFPAKPAKPQISYFSFPSAGTSPLLTNYDYWRARSLKVSVIVPNFNHSRFLEQRLGSIFEQTLPPHEIIFLDNASTDESVATARRLAHQAPLPMRIVVNDQNNGSTFRQWLKGLGLCSGDLIWIAEADDWAHPEFLERLVPEFHDPDVVLAYCQSALVGATGNTLANDFLGHTDDISESRWRSRYCVAGALEVEIALSQKNTIPNASAVVFRRTDHSEYAAELGNFRFAGDWLFYAMQLRTGKAAYLPQVLNAYRRHDQSVTSQSIRGDVHAEETLYVKSRVFESFPVSANAMARSMVQTISEYDHITSLFHLARPRLTANRRLTSSLDRIRAVFGIRTAAASELKVLIVAGDMRAQSGSLGTIQLANSLAQEHQVFLCNARPQECEPESVRRVSQRVTLLEGSLDECPWSAAADFTDQDHLQASHRVAMLMELIRVHRIDVIHSQSWVADRLVCAINEELDLPWFVNLASASAASPEHDTADPDLDRLKSRILSSIDGAFYERASEVEVLERLSIPSPRYLVQCPAGLAHDEMPPRNQHSAEEHNGDPGVEMQSRIDRIAAICAEAYLEARGAFAFSRTGKSNPQGKHDLPAFPPRRSA